MNNKFSKLLIATATFFSLNVTQAQIFNQAGYTPNSVKRIFLNESFSKQPFEVKNSKGEVLFNGLTTAFKYDADSGDKVCYAEFSYVNQPGQLEVLVAGTPVAKVVVDKNAYAKVGYNAVRYFYHERASMPIVEQYAGKFARPAGHPDDKVKIHASAASKKRPEGTIISSPGGWYDAGDFNKYIVNSSIATFTMLNAFELYQDKLKAVNYNIPESNDDVPDFLQETLYNLNWMLTMQDPKDGGVYHKLTSKTFCAVKMPHNDNSERFVVQKTTGATLDFAGTMAKASRILAAYEKQYPGLSKKCLKAAENAWKWALKNPNVIYKQPADIKTGEYGDEKLADEKFFAAAELYMATKKANYKAALDFSTASFDVPEWRRVSLQGAYSLAFNNFDEELKEKSKKEILKIAKELYNVYKGSGYRVSINAFPWGSNGEVSNQGVVFLHAYKLTDEVKYLEAADACMGYLLGANATGYCFVTGFGTKSPINPHERISQANTVAEPLPGFLVGGPTKQHLSDCGADKYPSTFPAKSYLDSTCSYSTNEIAINWGAALAHLVVGLDANFNK